MSRLLIGPVSQGDEVVLVLYEGPLVLGAVSCSVLTGLGFTPQSLHEVLKALAEVVHKDEAGEKEEGGDHAGDDNKHEVVLHEVGASEALGGGAGGQVEVGHLVSSHVLWAGTGQAEVA